MNAAMKTYVHEKQSDYCLLSQRSLQRWGASGDMQDCSISEHNESGCVNLCTGTCEAVLLKLPLKLLTP